MSTKSFSLTRSFDAPLDILWQAWSDEAALTSWIAPQGCPIVKSEMEFSEGGLFHYGMRLPTGMSMWGRWDYLEIAPKKRLVFLSAFSAEDASQTTRNPLAPTWPLHIHTSIEFSEKDGKAELVFTWTPHEASAMEIVTFDNSHEPIRMVWEATFKQLDAFAEKIIK